MTNEELINLLNADLRHELQHMHFYLHAGVQIQSMFRHEIGEFLLEEASDELNHCKEFSNLIVQLGGVPVVNGHDVPECDYTDPQKVLAKVIQLEDEVAARYSERLRQTEEHGNASTSYVHVFYEDQIADSWKTAREAELMLKKVVSIN